jgi:hypothetical protein
VTESTSAVEQAVQARIAAARIKVQAARERRDELSAARRRGLAARHSAKLRRLTEAEQRQDDEQTTPKENPMLKRTLTPGTPTGIDDDIRDHQYAIVQTRVERIPKLIKGLRCQEPDGCTQPATLATLAVEETTNEDDVLGLYLVKAPDGLPLCIVVCDEHRCEASHDLYFTLTERQRPDGIRAYDIPGVHLDWA